MDGKKHLMVSGGKTLSSKGGQGQKENMATHFPQNAPFISSQWNIAQFGRGHNPTPHGKDEMQDVCLGATTALSRRHSGQASLMIHIYLWRTNGANKKNDVFMGFKSLPQCTKKGRETDHVLKPTQVQKEILAFVSPVSQTSKPTGDSPATQAHQF